MMTIKTDELIWEQVLERLLTFEILSNQIKSYIKRATVVYIDSDSIVLSFPNPLTKSYVDSSEAIPLIKRCVFEITGKEITLITIISPQGEQPETQEPTQQEDIYNTHPQISSNLSFQQLDQSGRFPQRASDFTKKYTFDTFVVGESNQLAFGAAQAVAELPAKRWNPLFIYGRSGLGKTHLLCAIEDYLSRIYPHLKVLYFPAKELVDDISNYSITKEWDRFDKKYKSVDILLVDDIQFLEGKKESTELIFQLLTDFIISNKQFVLSADRSPRDIDMDERMTSRFMAGLVVDIQPPTFETKLAVLKSYREHYSFNKNIPDEVLVYISETSSSNIRELEGALLKVDSYISLMRNSSNMTVEKARDILTGFFPEKNSRRVSVSLIQREVEKYFSVTHEEMIGSKRDRRISYARQIAMYLSRVLTEESYPSVGKKFGGRDHTTILHGVKQIELQMKNNRELYDQVEKLSLIIKERA